VWGSHQQVHKLGGKMKERGGKKKITDTTPLPNSQAKTDALALGQLGRGQRSIVVLEGKRSLLYHRGKSCSIQNKTSEAVILIRANSKRRGENHTLSTVGSQLC